MELFVGLVRLDDNEDAPAENIMDRPFAIAEPPSTDRSSQGGLGGSAFCAFAFSSSC
jgi:hypothetical protein